MTQETVDFILPANTHTLAFLQLSLQDKLRAIELGTKFLQQGHHLQHAWNNEQWVTKMDILRAQYDEKIAIFETRISAERNKQNQLIENHRTTLETTRITMKTEIESIYRSKCEDLKRKVERMEDKLHKRDEENRTLYQTIYEDFEKRLDIKEEKWNEKIEILRADYEEKLALEKKEKESYVLRAQNSTLKGQVGEECMLQELNKRFPRADIEDTHKSTGRGDFILKEGAFGMLIEIKNYTKNVPKHEIDKFYKDMNTNHDIQCGVLLSLQSGVCAKADFHLEVTDGKPILFLHQMSKNMFHVELAVQLFKLILKTDSIDLTCKEITGKMKNSIPIIKRNWNKIRQKIQKFNKDIMDCVGEQEAIVRSMFELISLRY